VVEPDVVSDISVADNVDGAGCRSRYSEVPLAAIYVDASSHKEGVASEVIAIPLAAFETTISPVTS
jgi:hypothetical protein